MNMGNGTVVLKITTLEDDHNSKYRPSFIKGAVAPRQKVFPEWNTGLLGLLSVCRAEHSKMNVYRELLLKVDGQQRPEEWIHDG